MFSDTITIYHRVAEDGQEYWRGMVVCGVHTERSDGIRLRNSGATSRSQTLVLIPKKSCPCLLDIACPGDKLAYGAKYNRRIETPSECGEMMTITTISEVGGGGELAHWEITCNEFRR